jgi:hypothetical protein
VEPAAARRRTCAGHRGRSQGSTAGASVRGSPGRAMHAVKERPLDREYRLHEDRRKKGRRTSEERALDCDGRMSANRSVTFRGFDHDEGFIAGRPPLVRPATLPSFHSLGNRQSKRSAGAIERERSRRGNTGAGRSARQGVSAAITTSEPMTASASNPGERAPLDPDGFSRWAAEGGPRRSVRHGRVLAPRAKMCAAARAGTAKHRTFGTLTA